MTAQLRLIIDPSSIPWSSSETVCKDAFLVAAILLLFYGVYERSVKIFAKKTSSPSWQNSTWKKLYFCPSYEWVLALPGIFPTAPVQFAPMGQ